MTDNDKKKIEFVINNFDFEAIHKYMTDVDWTWIIGSGERVPSVEELKAAAREISTELMEQPGPGVISTGGLWVSKAEDGSIDLLFALAETGTWEMPPEEDES